MASLLRRRRRVLIDVDTQYDLAAEANHELSDQLCRIRRLIAWSRVRKIPIISTAICRSSSVSSVKPVGSPNDCIAGTAGQKKIHYTLLPCHVVFGPENRLDLPRNVLSEYQQVIFEKRNDDPFAQPRADRMLTDLKCDEFIVFGIGTTKGIKATVLGLLHRGKKVAVITDAIYPCKQRDAIMSLRQMEAKGAKLITVEEIAGKSRLRGQAQLRRQPVTISDRN